MAARANVDYQYVYDFFFKLQFVEKTAEIPLCLKVLNMYVRSTLTRFDKLI